MSGGLTDYYRRFPGDYRKDTCHLTLEEHGAYALLLDHCYSTESPILSISAAYKICSAVSKRERNSAKKVLEEFFELTDVGYTNNRVQKEISYADSISLVRRRAAEIKHKKHANAQQMQVQMPAIPDNQTTRQPETHTPMREFATPAFQKFWELYPAKLDKAEAIRAWFRVPFADRSVDAIIAGVEIWKSSDRWQEERFIPSAAKFLSNRRWEATPPRGKNEEGRRKTKTAIANILAAGRAMDG